MNSAPSQGRMMVDKLLTTTRFLNQAFRNIDLPPLSDSDMHDIGDALAQACFAIAQKRVNELEERVRTLEFHVAQRGAALAPFAEACSNCIDDEPDNGSTWEHPVSMEVTFRDFRDARDVLDLPSAALPTTESEEEMK